MTTLMPLSNPRTDGGTSLNPTVSIAPSLCSMTSVSVADQDSLLVKRQTVNHSTGPVQECQSYSQFHNCSYLLRIWQRALARFLVPPEELHLAGPKPNCHTPGLDAPVLCKLPLLHLGDKNISFSSGNQGPVSLSANIANICIPSQIICNCYSKVFDVFNILKDCTL